MKLYFNNFYQYNLKPSMFLSYYRRAYYEKEDSDFRLTFDSDILARNYDLELEIGSGNGMKQNKRNFLKWYQIKR